MSGFPPKKWEARFLQDMETLQCSQKEGETLSMEAYVAVKPSGARRETFDSPWREWRGSGWNSR